MEINSKILEYLRLAVNEKEMSDTEVAKATGIPQSTIFRLLNAKTLNPSYLHVIQVCRCLKITPPLFPTEPKANTCTRITIGWENQIENCIKTTQMINEGLSVGFLVDDSANKHYKIGTFLILSEVLDFDTLEEGDIIIAQTLDIKDTKFIPLQLVESPHKNEWLLCHMSKNTEKQNVYIVSKNTNSTQIQIVYKVEGSFLN